MSEKSYLTTRWLAMTWFVLIGLISALALLTLQLDFLQVPLTVYSYVSLAASSYAAGYAFRVPRGLFLLPRMFGVLTACLGMALVMLGFEMQLGAIGFSAVVVLILFFLALGVLRKPLTPACLQR